MRIHCECCGTEIEKETAEIVEDEGQVYHFCSPECRSEKGYHETMDAPGRDERASPPDIR